MKNTAALHTRRVAPLPTQAAPVRLLDVLNSIASTGRNEAMHTLVMGIVVAVTIVTII
jgi:hypothetical protein